MSAEQRVEVDVGEVADHDGGRGGGAYVLLVEGAYGRRVDRGDRLLGALARARHARGRREELPGELLGGAAGRVGGLVRDLVEPVAHQPLDLAVLEGGCPEGVGEQAERLGEPGDGDFEADPYAGVVGVRVEGGAAALQLGGELLGGVLVGALGEGTRHDRGDAVQALRLGLQRGGQEDLDGDDLLAGAVAAQHRQAVAERAALGGREGPGPGLAGLGLRVEFHRGELGHLAASSSVSSAASVSSASSATVGS